MNTRLFLPQIIFAILIIVSTPGASGQADASGDWAGPTSAPSVVHNASTGSRWDHDVASAVAYSASVANVKVTIDASKLRNIVGYRAFGVNANVHDESLVNPKVVSLLNAAAINTLRYPGGAYADTYHWSTYKPTQWQGEKTPRNGEYSPNNNFGFFVRLLDYVKNGTAVITVNYGSNLAGTGAGDPEAAAAWVAYCNGDPSDKKVISKDSSGYDWKTVGFWATIRSSLPLSDDDGFNQLRIEHPKSLNIKYWEIGNEVYGNDYFADDSNGGSAEDLHAPYAANGNDSDKIRHGNPALSPSAYGRGVAAFARAMKNVDPGMKIGAALVNPIDEKKALEWNPAVMAECGKIVDFVILHWNVDNVLPPDWKKLDEAAVLRAPQVVLPKIGGELVELFHKYSGENASKMQFVVTEVGTTPFASVSAPVTQGLFAADAYASLMEMGAATIDWADLHGSHFLDDKNVQGPAYYGIQMVHLLANINDQLVEAKTSVASLTVHAAKRADGSVAVMLINKSPKEKSTVKLQISGAT